MTKKQTAETFWARVAVTDDDDCWVWAGSVGSTGYGSVRWDGKTYLVHRVAAWLLGIIADPRRERSDMSSVVMHGCDNKLCCNPNHLFASTQSENVSEQYSKGRRKAPDGELSQNATISNEVAKKIYDAYHSAGYTMAKCMEEFDATRSVVEAIVSKRRYKSIHEDYNTRL